MLQFFLVIPVSFGNSGFAQSLKGLPMNEPSQCLFKLKAQKDSTYR